MKKQYLYTILTGLTLASLVGCDSSIKSEEWYMSHHKELIAKYADCLNTHTFSSPECIPVVNAKRRTQDDPDVAQGIKKVTQDFVRHSMTQGRKNE
ncbi:EexN family lipoprotein [Erwinia typographi]|uniref:EexN family lipoprotein n=1 Tax=Erwinia typographi TaxID=371042 RepID=UPI001E51CF81|nr:EexN family lipoprotein [Erwinia typographi]